MTVVAAPIIVKAGAREEMVGFIVTTIFILIFITLAVAIAIYDICCQEVSRCNRRYVVSNLLVVISTIFVVSLLWPLYLLWVWSRIFPFEGVFDSGYVLLDCTLSLVVCCYVAVYLTFAQFNL